MRGLMCRQLDPRGLQEMVQVRGWWRAGSWAQLPPLGSWPEGQALCKKPGYELNVVLVILFRQNVKVAKMLQV